MSLDLSAAGIDVGNRLAILNMTYKKIYKLTDSIYIAVINEYKDEDDIILINILTSDVLEKREHCLKNSAEEANELNYYSDIKIINGLVATTPNSLANIPFRLYNDFGDLIKSIEIKSVEDIVWLNLVDNKLIILIIGIIGYYNLWCIIYNNNTHQIEEYYDKVMYFWQPHSSIISIVLGDKYRTQNDYEVDN